MALLANTALAGVDIEELDSAWDVFDVDSTGTAEIQRVGDDVEPVVNTVRASAFEKRFFSDMEAIGYVMTRALEGDARSADAIFKCYGVTLGVGRG